MEACIKPEVEAEAPLVKGKGSGGTPPGGFQAAGAGLEAGLGRSVVLLLVLVDVSGESGGSGGSRGSGGSGGSGGSDVCQPEQSKLTATDRN